MPLHLLDMALISAGFIEAIFCPFCGVRYDAPQFAETAGAEHYTTVNENEMQALAEASSRAHG